MIPALSAEETLAAATAAALGAGGLKKGDAGRIVSSLRRRTRGGPVPKATPAALAAMGIAVEEVD